MKVGGGVGSEKVEKSVEDYSRTVDMNRGRRVVTRGAGCSAFLLHWYF